MTKSAVKSVPAPVAENAAPVAVEAATARVVTSMGAPPSRAGAAPSKPAPHALDRLGSGASLEEVAAALGIDPAAPQAPEVEQPEADGEDIAPAAEGDPAPEPEGEEQPAAPVGAEWNDPLVKERPAYIPAKFKNLEAFAKSYAFLEKKQGQQAAAPKPGPLKIEKAAEPKPGDAPAFKLDQQGMMELAVEWDAEGGKLTDTTYAKLEAVGITREAADEYGRLKSAERDRMVDGALQKHGLDRAAAQELVAWAGQNLPAEEIEAINGLLETPNPVMWEMAFQRLKTAHGGATRAVRPRQAGRSDAGTSVKPMTNPSEIAQAVGDPRYGNDDAYTAEVNQRISLGQRT